MNTAKVRPITFDEPMDIAVGMTGFAIWSTDGALVEVRMGSSTGRELFSPLEIAAGATDRQSFGVPLTFDGTAAVFFGLLSGDAEGSVWSV